MAAFCLDRAIALFGSAVENDIHQAQEGAKNQAEAKRKVSLVITKWFGTETSKSQFRNPVATV